MLKRAKLSSKYQIVIPKEMREYAHLKAGDELIMSEGQGKLILLKRPKSYTDYMEGLHQDLWENVDIDQYIAAERRSWKTT